jgi:hypothetical protein
MLSSPNYVRCKPSLQINKPTKIPSFWSTYLDLREALSRSAAPFTSSVSLFLFLFSLFFVFACVTQVS